MTALEVGQLRKFHELAGKAPYRHSMPTVPGPIKTVEGVFDWLSTYLRHVEVQAAKLQEKDQARARAEVVLRGLRQDVANVVSTLEDLDAAVEARTLDTVLRDE